MARYDLSEAEWRLIEPLLPNKPRGVARVDQRRVINGIFCVLRTRSPWRDLPSRYGPHTTVSNRYNRWAKAVEDLRGAGGEARFGMRRQPPRSDAATCPDRSVQNISGHRVRK
jgi:transposase